MPNQKKFYIGVEGGATKSTALLVNDEDRVLLEGKGKALNYHNLGEQTAKKNLKALLAPMLSKARTGKVYAVFGLSGLDTPKDKAAYNRIVKAVLPKNSVFELVNDTNVALEVRCPDEKRRVVVIAGTGSNVYGENGVKKASSIGWGYVFGDEGSGYDTGMQILKAAIRSYDGRGKKTILEKLLVKKFGGKTMQDVTPAVYAAIEGDDGNGKRYIASLARLLDEAIQQKDKVALELRSQIVEQLVSGISAVTNRLNMTKESFCLGTTGSLWEMPGLKEEFRRKVKASFPKVTFSTNTEPSLQGTILLAKKL